MSDEIVDMMLLVPPLAWLAWRGRSWPGKAGALSMAGLIGVGAAMAAVARKATTVRTLKCMLGVVEVVG